MPYGTRHKADAAINRYLLEARAPHAEIITETPTTSLQGTHSDEQFHRA
jgi:hypothetical protein